MLIIDKIKKEQKKRGSGETFMMTTKLVVDKTDFRFKIFFLPKNPQSLSNNELSGSNL